MELPLKYVIVVENFNSPEISAITSLGIKIIQINEQLLKAFDIRENLFEIQSYPVLAILRSPRIPLDCYSYLFNLLKMKNINLINTPEMVRSASEFNSYYPYIKEKTPRSISMAHNISPSELYQKLIDSGLRFPVFVKTEIKSLKSSSIIENPDLNSLVNVMKMLREQFPVFNSIIVREMLPLRSVADNESTTLEYRSFVFRGRIINIESVNSGIPPIHDFNGDFFLEECIKQLARYQFSNFYVIDVGVLREKDQLIIIEIKEGQFTRIRNFDLFWSKILNSHNSRGK